MTDLGSYVNKTVDFKFMGVQLRFDLSHGLFSSFDIDLGTRLLLKAVARDPVLARARRILDEGCGVGVLGLCAAKAFPEAEVTLRDRDSLATAFAERNRELNKLRGVAAWRDPETGEERKPRAAPRIEWGLLGDAKEDESGLGYDFVLSNLPAKAGAPVLERFFARLSGRSGAALLVPGGRAGVVIVKPLADAASAWIQESGLLLVSAEQASMHRVFVVERPSGTPAEAAEAAAEPGFSIYTRGEARFKLAQLGYRARGFWGLPEFDTPSYGSSASAELLARALAGTALQGKAWREALFVEPGVGHLALWAARALRLEGVTAASRDLLSLKATESNLGTLPERTRPRYTAVDALSDADLPDESFDLVAESPDIVPERDWIGESWRLAGRVLRPGGIYLACCSPTEMTRFERRRPSGQGLADGGEPAARWSLLGQKRKKGFVSAVWRKS